jgi:hypothetical protein
MRLLLILAWIAIASGVLIAVQRSFGLTGTGFGIALAILELVILLGLDLFGWWSGWRTVLFKNRIASRNLRVFTFGLIICLIAIVVLMPFISTVWQIFVIGNAPIWWYYYQVTYHRPD